MNARNQTAAPAASTSVATSPIHLRSNPKTRLVTVHTLVRGGVHRLCAHRISQYEQHRPRVQHQERTGTKTTTGAKPRDILGIAKTMLHTRQSTCGVKTRPQRHRQTGQYLSHTSAAMRKQGSPLIQTLACGGVDKQPVHHISLHGQHYPRVQRPGGHRGQHPQHTQHRGIFLNVARPMLNTR